jgi:hypothetical protein
MSNFPFWVWVALLVANAVSAVWADGWTGKGNAFAAGASLGVVLYGY